MSSSDALTRPVTLVLIGAHASGKSTLASRLAVLTGWVHAPELGWELRAARPSNSVECFAPQPLFEAAVLEGERARDAARLTTAACAVVETWHAGNLAWAAVRSPDILAGLRESAFAAAADYSRCRCVLVQPLRSSAAATRGRRERGAAVRVPGTGSSVSDCEDSLLARTARVAALATAFAAEMGLRILPDIDTSQGATIDESVTMALQHVLQALHPSNPSPAGLKATLAACASAGLR